MKPTEAAALLTICAAYDNRKPDADTAKAWAMVLDGLRFEDCRDAVVEHYRVSTDWIMPAHIGRIVRRTRASRIEDAAPIAIPPGFDPDDTAAYQRLLVENQRAQAEGRAVPQPTGEAVPRDMSFLRTLVRRALPPGAPKPEKSPESEAQLEAVKAELAARVPIPIPDGLPAELPTPPPEPTPAPATPEKHLDEESTA